jgi:hypothetical protein
LEALAVPLLPTVSRTFDLALLRVTLTQLASVAMAARPLHPTCLAVLVLQVLFSSENITLKVEAVVVEAQQV